MADKIKIKLIIGFSLVAVAFICVAAILFFLGGVNQENQEKAAALEVRLANSIAEKADANLNEEDAMRVKRTPVKLEDFLARAESIYGKQEMNRKEGVFWVDRKSSSMMVNLGAVNGLRPGSALGVYEGESKIADVTVVSTLDLISYVNPVEKKLDDFKNNYYRVVINK